jgi:CheY-like chemotaxis protein
MPNWRILTIEDDPDGQEVVGVILRYHNITTDIVSSGEEALSMLNSTRYDGVIIDLHLPGIDGWSLLNVIRNQPATANLPCVAITAYHTDDLAIKAIEAGFKAYFPKPLEATGFVRELERVF